MATFSTRIQSLVGTNITETDLDQWCLDGVREIINIIPSKLIHKCSTEESITNTDGLLSYDTKEKIVGITRYDGTRQQPCREVPGMYRGRVNDSADLMYYGTTSDPVYWIWNNALGVYPDPSDTNIVNVLHVKSDYLIDASADSVIDNFPNEGEYLVVLYAAVKALQKVMTGMNESIKHSDQDGTYNTAGGLVAGTGGSQGWEVVRHFIETEEDMELSSPSIQALTAEMQQFAAEYQWYQGQQAKLQQDYDKGIQLLISGGIPPQPPPQAKG